MRAQVLRRIGCVEEEPLELEDVRVPLPLAGEVLVRVSACGVCHTELDEVEGRLRPRLPVVLGHQVVGRVCGLGSGASRFGVGERVGVAWINWACGVCYHCRRGFENLCDGFLGTGFDVDGGYAEYMVVGEDFAYVIPECFSDLEVAPLLCAGAIGFRALRLSGLEDYGVIGLYGYGASAHIVHQIVKFRFPNARVFVFTRRKDDSASVLARDLGADWVGVTGEVSPEKLNCVIDTTPVGFVVGEALRNLEKGGRLVMNLIRKETLIPELDYVEHLWREKEVKSVANITRRDVEEFLPLAAQIPIVPKIREFKLEEANQALVMLKHGKYRGAGVLNIQ